LGVFIAAYTLASCQMDEEPDDGCATLRDAFVDEVWSPLLGETCVTCHQPGGLAWEKNARLVLVPSTYPGFIEQNIASLRSLAGYEYDGEPLLLAKPLGRADHGGGQVLNKGSDAYERFKRFLDRLSGDPATAAACENEEAPLSDVVLLSPEDTLRKATVTLLGRLPTDAELAPIRASGTPEEAEGHLAAALRSVVTVPGQREPGVTEPFEEWLMTAWNDVLLTDLYTTSSNRSLSLLSDKDFPNAHGGYYDDLDGDTKALVGRAVATEPLRLIAHVVREGRSFSEILTASYSLYNPFSANVYYVDTNFGGSLDPEDWREGHMYFEREGEPVYWPHAGILSSPMLLNRRPTTPTNLNRHRAWWVLRTFLATDVLTVADRPVDPDKASSFDYPWRQDAQCVVCHAVIDPVAGAYSQFDDSDQERFWPTQAPPANVFDPGFYDLSMPPSPTGGRLRWLGEQIVEDPRFPLAIARLTFTMLTGREPIEHPRDPSAATYAAEEAAWREFDREMVRVVDRFTASDLDYRELLVALMTGPYFRADGTVEAPSDDRAAELADVGTARFLTPELLDKKITALTGVSWIRGWDRRGWLRTDYQILYGGIDSDNVTRRLGVPNGVMASVADRMANEVACTATAWDFTKAPGQRLLFPTVDLDDQPTTLDGDDVPAAIGRIKATIVHLHERLLGEHLSPEDPEVTRTFELFKATLEAGRVALSDESEGTWLACGARKDPLTGEDLPEEMRIDRDPHYVVRAWMAVVTYMLSDFRFLYD